MKSTMPSQVVLSWNLILQHPPTQSPIYLNYWNVLIIMKLKTTIKSKVYVKDRSKRMYFHCCSLDDLNLTKTALPQNSSIPSLISHKSFRQPDVLNRPPNFIVVNFIFSLRCLIPKTLLINMFTSFTVFSVSLE